MAQIITLASATKNCVVVLGGWQQNADMWPICTVTQIVEWLRGHPAIIIVTLADGGPFVPCCFLVIFAF